MSKEHSEAIEAWSRAKTLNDLGEITALWIEHRLNFHPCYGDGPDSETDEIAGYLANFNRLGLVTTHSQPAEAIDDSGSGQRACIEGYASEETAKRLAAVTLHTDLLVFIFEPGGTGGYQIQITTQNFLPFTWCGGCCGQEQLFCFEEVCGLDAKRALANAWTVVAIDPEWGRKSRLWCELSKVLQGKTGDRYSISPSPDLELDSDFVR